MSTAHPAPDPLQPSLFRERMILSLLPYFLPLAANFEEARAEALETLAAYGVRTRAEVINAVRIIAFSFASLDLLGEAQSDDMPPAMRLRYSAHANSLSRSCQQDEKTLAVRQAQDVPVAAAQAAEPMTEAELEAAIQQAHIQVANARACVSAAQATLAQEMDANQPPWSGPMIAAPATPFRHASPA